MNITLKSAFYVILGICAVMARCSPSEAPLEGDGWQSVSSSGEGRVVVLYVPAEGFAYRDEVQRLTGVTVEIMRNFATWVENEYGVDLSVDFQQDDDWRRFYERVKNAEGGVFGIGNVTTTDARRQELRFSPPYLTNIAVLISHLEVAELDAMEDFGRVFSGLTPLAFEGTLHEERLDSLRARYLPGSPMGFAASNAEIIERVSSGGYLAYVDVYNYWRAAEAGAPLRRHRVADEPSEEFGIIMPLNSDWADVVDAFFADGPGFRNSQAYRGILEAHLGSELTDLLEKARTELDTGDPSAPGLDAETLH